MSISGFGQKSDKLPRYFADPILVDSSSTLMIPTRYSAELLSSNKIALWNNYYANILFYDFKTDSTKRLFKEDTFIKGFSNDNNSYYRSERTNRPDNISSKWIFYFVKSTDYNKSGRVDNEDPTVLFVSDKHGNGLKSITLDTENTVSIDFFDKQGFALVKMQRDLDKDTDFESDDNDYYYVRLDLNTLMLGNKIEVSN